MPHATEVLFLCVCLESELLRGTVVPVLLTPNADQKQGWLMIQ